MADDKPKWDTPENAQSSRVNEPGELTVKHGISVDRARMLIDRLGNDPKALEEAAKALSTRIKDGR